MSVLSEWRGREVIEVDEAIEHYEHEKKFCEGRITDKSTASNHYRRILELTEFALMALDVYGSLMSEAEREIEGEEE